MGQRPRHAYRKTCSQKVVKVQVVDVIPNPTKWIPGGRMNSVDAPPLCLGLDARSFSKFAIDQATIWSVRQYHESMPSSG
jgi:hypothetical protein